MSRATRVYSVGDDGETLGMTIPQLAALPTLALGESTVFADLSDLAMSTVQSHAPVRAQASFGIVETAGSDITVRVTMLFSDPRWLAAPSQSREYEIGANELLVVDNPGRSILGPSRDTVLGDLLGDLLDVQLRFQVVQGDGAATIFVIESDTGSGDMVFRLQ